MLSRIVANTTVITGRMRIGLITASVGWAPGGVFSTRAVITALVDEVSGLHTSVGHF